MIETPLTREILNKLGLEEFTKRDDQTTWTAWKIIDGPKCDLHLIDGEFHLGAGDTIEEVKSHKTMIRSIEGVALYMMLHVLEPKNISMDAIMHTAYGAEMFGQKVSDAYKQARRNLSNQ